MRFVVSADSITSTAEPNSGGEVTADR